MDLQLLFEEARNGCERSQNLIFNEFASKMLILCTRYLQIKEDAEERMLDGFLIVFDKKTPFTWRSELDFIKWVTRIMVTECKNFLRAKNSLNVTRVSEREAENIPVENIAWSEYNLQDIYHHITNLPVGYRTVFNLYAIDGYTHEEIASELGITQNASQQRFNNAKLLLQKALLKNEGHGKQGSNQ